ncbi:unnamed protein product [Miscanthus lutarioriparius]|uniref:Late embryogenesis abundant protein LEA-2 subgroup domain-containing protein n=1 Tax=Miscanthus lutarioriparius TaxID=422564 RepID=A0A811S6R0_9POAL|nr:unnamed protein product [Miscanthus lutarioriparius]
MAPVDGDAAEKSPFRWIDAARYVVASVVAVLIIAVIVNAIKVVLRPESLFFSVSGGCVPMVRINQSSSQPMLVLQLGLRADNPAGRARMYYVGITGYLFDKNVSAASLHPSSDCIVSFRVKDKVVEQKKAVVSSVNIKANRRTMERSYFDLLYSGNGSTFFRDVTMRLDGTLITEVPSGFNASSRRTTYYCPQLLVGGDSSDDDAFKNRPDVVCST